MFLELVDHWMICAKRFCLVCLGTGSVAKRVNHLQMRLINSSINSGNGARINDRPI